MASFARTAIIPALALAFGAACVAAGSAAGGPAHRLLVLNGGNEPIFTLRTAPAGQTAWGPDLLQTDVIDVSRGKDVTIVLDGATCAYDVEAAYPDGHVQVRAAVDLCSAGRISFDH